MCQKKWLFLLASIFMFAMAGTVRADFIDFTSMPAGPISSDDGVTFSLIGGPGSGVPYVPSFGYNGIGNSPTGEYPTSSILDFSFATPVSDVSFSFNNYGFGGGPGTGRGASFYEAFAGATLVDTGYIGNLSPSDPYTYAPVAVSGAGITDLQVNNGSGGGSSWEFGVGSLAFTPSAVPEPSRLIAVLSLCGMGLIGMVWRRRRAAA